MITCFKAAIRSRGYRYFRDQFYAEVITECIPVHKMFLQCREEDITQFHRNHLNHNNFLGGISQPEMALKLEVGVLSFNPRLSFPSVATDDRKQFQYLHIVLDQLNNKTGLLFYFLKSKPNSQPRPQGTFP